MGSNKVLQWFEFFKTLKDKDWLMSFGVAHTVHYVESNISRYGV